MMGVVDVGNLAVISLMIVSDHLIKKINVFVNSGNSFS